MARSDEQWLAVLADLRRAFDDALRAALREVVVDLPEADVDRLVRATVSGSGALSYEQIVSEGRAVKAAEVRPKRGTGRGKEPGPWVRLALELPVGEGKEWTLSREAASKAANAVTSKRRRSGKKANGRWKVPIWASVRPEGVGGDYVLTVVNDPEDRKSVV